jgi:FkbM family methyltransferase
MESIIEREQLPALLRWLQNIEFPHKLGIMERLFARRLSKHGITWVDTAAGLRWKLDLTNSTHRWIVYGKYEGAGFHQWIEHFVSSRAVIVDSGANIGQMLLYLAQMIPQGKLLAFEPGAIQAKWLCECLHANPELPVEVIQVGLGAKSQSAFLCDSGKPITHGGQSMVSEKGGEAINIVRLEDALVERGITTVDFWKLDVEGYEIPALEGARGMLERKSIRAIYVELHAENGVRIRDYLGAFGYQCHRISGSGRLSRMFDLPEHTNGLFLSRGSARMQAPIPQHRPESLATGL